MSPTPAAAHLELVERSREQCLLQSCSALLEWDEETYLPDAGVLHRSAQLSLLARLLHERVAAPRFGELIELVSASPLAADPRVQADLRIFRRRHQRAACLEPRFVEELARTVVLSQQAWSVARGRSDFSILKPHLSRMIDLKREEAAACAPELSAYDALLDEYEPEARAAELAPLFAAISAALGPLVREIGARPQAPIPLLRRVSLRKQKLLSEAAAAGLGFDRQAGRLDTSAHPFTVWIGPGDVRVTTRFALDDPWRGFFATLHEVGHALYDQSLDAEAYGRAAGEAGSAAVHESQARLVENIVGRSEGFWQGFFPTVHKLLGEVMGLSAEPLFRAVNAVAPGPLRIVADELTYDLHIAVRFELERALIAGELPLDELPAAWRAAYRERLGVEPTDDAAGCLQDGHWAAGMFGYFPTYTLGNVIASQLFQAAEAVLGEQDPCFARGDFAPLLGWLRSHVHRVGHTRTTRELVAEATGAPLAPAALIRRLQEKARRLYGL